MAKKNFHEIDLFDFTSFFFFWPRLFKIFWPAVFCIKWYTHEINANFLLSIAEVFNLVRYHVPPAKMSAKSQREILDKFNLSEMTSSLCMDKRLYSRELSKAERSKQDKFNVISKSRDECLESIIETLTPDDIRCLIRAEDELVHATHFSRIFPTQVKQ